jgi:toxoflavin synthase
MMRVVTDIKGAYDAAAATYTTVDELPIRRYAEVPTFLAALDDVTGAEVLDLACGSGFLTRIISARRAARVVGVDASAPMIELARSAVVEGQPIEYHVHDVAAMPPLGSFDVVTAGFLLNYSSSRAELATVCRRAFACVRPGGRFVGSVPDSRYDLRRLHDTRYG